MTDVERNYVWNGVNKERGIVSLIIYILSFQIFQLKTSKAELEEELKDMQLKHNAELLSERNAFSDLQEKYLHPGMIDVWYLHY